MGTQYHVIVDTVKQSGKDWHTVRQQVMDKIDAIIARRRRPGRRRLKDTPRQSALRIKHATLDMNDPELDALLNSIADLEAVVAYAANGNADYCSPCDLAQQATGETCRGCGGETSNLAGSDADTQYHVIVDTVKQSGKDWHTVRQQVMDKIDAIIARRQNGGRRRLKNPAKVKHQVKQITLTAEELEAIEARIRTRFSVHQLKAIMDYIPDDHDADDVEWRFLDIAHFVGDKWNGPDGPVYNEVMAMIQKVHDAKIAIKYTNVAAKLRSFYGKVY